MPVGRTNRRAFIAGLSVAAWPVVAHAQQAAMPVIGFLSPGSREADTGRMNASAGVWRKSAILWEKT